MVDDDKRGKIEAHILALKNIPLFFQKHHEEFLKTSNVFSKTSNVFFKTTVCFKMPPLAKLKTFIMR